MRTIFFFSTLLFSLFSMAQTLTMEEVTMKGSGCPPGSVSATLSPDGRALSVLYSGFIVEGTGTDQKDCQVVARMRAPQGYRVHMASADLRGFNGLPVGAQSQFNTTIRFTDWRDWSKSQDYSQTFKGPVADNFFVQMQTPESRWGNCGGMLFYIVLDSRLILQNQSAEGAMLSLDSSDIQSGPANVYHLELDDCHGGGGNGNGHGNGNGNSNGNGGNGHGNGRGNGNGRFS